MIAHGQSSHTPSIVASDLILSDTGHIYHLGVQPGDIAETVILVGDPARVPMITRYFDEITVQHTHREFVVHTGRLGKKRLSVVSTGIGAGSIDIAVNELDALLNIDFETRQPKSSLTRLQLIRLGTCGGLLPDLPLGAKVLSDYAITFDGLLNFYSRKLSPEELDLMRTVKSHFAGVPGVDSVVTTSASPDLCAAFSDDVWRGITMTCAGFYAPQGRKVRAEIAGDNVLDLAQTFVQDGRRIVNFEMETADIFGLGSALGHACCSISTVLANRTQGQFIDDAQKAVSDMIQWALEKISDL